MHINEMLLLWKNCPCKGGNKHAFFFSQCRNVKKHLLEDEAVFNCRYQLKSAFKKAISSPISKPSVFYFWKQHPKYQQLRCSLVHKEAGTYGDYLAEAPTQSVSHSIRFFRALLSWVLNISKARDVPTFLCPAPRFDCPHGENIFPCT